MGVEVTIQFASSFPAVLRRPSLVSLFVALALVGCGSGGGSDAANPQPEPSPPPVASKGNVSVLAGSLGGPGNLDAVGSAARFDIPTGLAIGPSGNLYVADTNNQRVRKITPEGAVSTVAGSGQAGYVDGPAMQALFCYPSNLAVGPDASVFVVDGTVRKIDMSGNVKTVAGSPIGGCLSRNFAEKPAPKAPSAVAVDAFGIAYIADSFAGAIYTLTPAGALTLLAGSEDDKRPNLDFSGSTGMVFDAARNVYVLGAFVPDLSTRSIVRISQTGEITTVVPASPALAATFDMAGDAAGNLYVTDAPRSVVRKITPDGSISIIAGVNDNAHEGGNVDGPLGTGRLNFPTGIAVAADGTVYVSEPYTHTIRRIDPVTGNLSTLAGRVPRGPFFGNYAIDRAGNIFFAVYKPYPEEAGIGRIAPDGTATTLVSGGLKNPGGMALDSAGNLYVLDSTSSSIKPNERTVAFVVRKITPQGEMSIFAGKLEESSTTPGVDVDGVGPAARLYNARALTIDPAGNLYVAQYLGAPLRKVTPQGVVSTISMTLPGTEQFPNAVAADGAGNTYLVSCARVNNGRSGQPNAAILKVDPKNNVSLLAGSLTEAGYVDGAGAQARFAAIRGIDSGLSFSSGTCPSGLALDATGNVYVADTGNDTVRKITPDGVVSTAVGQQGVRGVAPGPLPASLSQPAAVSFDAVGNLYVVSEGALLKVQLGR